MDEDSLHKRRTMPEAAPSLQHDAPERVKSLPVQSTQPSGEGATFKKYIILRTHLFFYYVKRSIKLKSLK